MATVAVQTTVAPAIARLRAMPKFNPDQHLVGALPAKKMTMQELGFEEDVGVSPVAVSDPFQLFTAEAVKFMRGEVFRVPEKYKFSSNIAKSQLRGYAKDCAPFTWDAWNHPATIALMSKIAEVELVPAMPYEIAHINLSAKSKEDAQQELAQYQEQNRRYQEDEGIGGCREVVETPIVGWHTDSYPFVCVLMMSDVGDMVGGETAIRTADGKILKMRGPSQGCAVLMQGRYITHQAMRALGAQERITSVTSFRPKSALFKDDTELRTVRGVSDLNELYYDFAEYRLKLLQEQIQHERERVAAARRTGEGFATTAHKQFLKRVIAFSNQSSHELVEQSEVQQGYIERVDWPDAAIDL
ncbi:uncharacterized protein N0V89_012343 [Didymosphaeria variabile]|uniref:Fe2OG dioxygenase domain-containing protein n=1 Tax=Didymosphaeria variabile TaxID=1932322 RepID=A0A9W8X902_9PLEO|nr:uncharacterized protein N0V89_012343 [Didymosphaeria variabile]KAJ4344599.1 hypothetical protein N0V89_012343 [Didymosphaeria variabile]